MTSFFLLLLLLPARGRVLPYIYHDKTQFLNACLPRKPRSPEEEGPPMSTSREPRASQWDLAVPYFSTSLGLWNLREFLAVKFEGWCLKISAVGKSKFWWPVRFYGSMFGQIRAALERNDQGVTPQSVPKRWDISWRLTVAPHILAGSWPKNGWSSSCHST